MKRRSLIALLLAGVIITNCVSCSDDKKTKLDNEPEETEETTVETTETPATTVEPTATPTPTLKPTAAPTPKPTTAPAKLDVDIDDLTSDELYSLYRKYAEEINKDQEGLLYGFHDTWLAATKEYYWTLSVVYPDGSFSFYVSAEGEMTDISSALAYNNPPDDVLAYDDFMKLPCLVDNFFLSKSEIVDTIEDGKYFGDAFNFSSDGKYMFAVVGDPVTVTREEFEALEVGDVICTGLYGNDYVVTEVSVNPSGERVVAVSDDCWFVNNAFTLDEDTYLLVSSSSNPEYINPKVVVLPIADDCVIDDKFELFVPEGYDDYVAGLEDPNVITSSVFWYQQLYEVENLSVESDFGNGWVYAKALLYPIVIEDGQVVEVSLQWR